MKILGNKMNEAVDTSSISKQLSLGDGIGFKLVSGANVNNYVTAANELIAELENLNPDDKFAAARCRQAREYITRGRQAVNELVYDVQQLNAGAKNALQLLETLEATLNSMSE